MTRSWRQGADLEERRAAFEAALDLLPGRKLQGVAYWELPYEGHAPGWDRGDWHLAEMGVELQTDQGPLSVTWSDTFFAYGMEVFSEPMASHLGHGEGGPMSIVVGPDASGPWASLIGAPIRKASATWETVHVGPGRRVSDGKVVSPAEDIDVPTTLRLDFDVGSVWMVAAMPGPTDPPDIFMLGDEVMVMFSRESMEALGFDDPDYFD